LQQTVLLQAQSAPHLRPQIKTTTLIPLDKLTGPPKAVRYTKEEMQERKKKLKAANQRAREFNKQHPNAAKKHPVRTIGALDQMKPLAVWSTRLN
jgi:nicotinic acid mononucleotide adenylyltransferase